mmetsp:Transcript_128727/g.372488  ORF Transcript_128727/g.372488 Transcript_128727/m.372488 type:complete len:222 (-) Transcript_128727:623-1288(-)
MLAAIFRMRSQSATLPCMAPTSLALGASETPAPRSPSAPHFCRSCCSGDSSGGCGTVRTRFAVSFAASQAMPSALRLSRRNTAGSVLLLCCRSTTGSEGSREENSRTENSRKQRSRNDALPAISGDNFLSRSPPALPLAQTSLSLSASELRCFIDVVRKSPLLRNRKRASFSQLRLMTNATIAKPYKQAPRKRHARDREKATQTAAICPVWAESASKQRVM